MWVLQHWGIDPHLGTQGPFVLQLPELPPGFEPGPAAWKAAVLVR